MTSTVPRPEQREAGAADALLPVLEKDLLVRRESTAARVAGAPSRTHTRELEAALRQAEAQVVPAVALVRFRAAAASAVACPRALPELRNGRHHSA